MNHLTKDGAGRLKKWRRQIDRLDNELLRLINQRAKIACELGAVKIAYGLPAYDGRRERQVLSRMRAVNRGPLSGESVANIFRRVILETRRIGIETMRQERRKSFPRRGKNIRAREASLAVRRLSKEQNNGH